MMANSRFPHISRQIPKNACAMGVLGATTPSRRAFCALCDCSPRPNGRTFPKQETPK